MKLIVAMSKNLGIGLKNKLPWRLKGDLEFFKNKTIGNGNNVILMGKNTWESLPKKPLVNRFNCILSTSLNIDNSNSKSFKNELEFDTFIENKDFDDVWIIGGEEIYKHYITSDKVEELYITNIKNEIKCDTFFPEIPHNFKLVEISSKFIENDIIYNYEKYIKL